MSQRFYYTKILQYFLQGLLIIAPLAITVYALYFIISTIDNWLPIFSYTNEKGRVIVQNYGLGFLIILLAIIAIGYFSSFFITGRLINFMDRVMDGCMAYGFCNPGRHGRIWFPGLCGGIYPHGLFRCRACICNSQKQDKTYYPYYQRPNDEVCRKRRRYHG